MRWSPTISRWCRGCVAPSSTVSFLRWHTLGLSDHDVCASAEVPPIGPATSHSAQVRGEASDRPKIVDDGCGSLTGRIVRGAVSAGRVGEGPCASRGGRRSSPVRHGGSARRSRERLTSEGARVLIADIDEAAATSTAAAIGERALAHRLDVTDAASWAAAVERARGAWGRLDILVNNAGIAGRSAPAWELDGRGVARGDRDRPDRRLPRLPRRAAADDRGRERPHRQHRLDRRQRREPERRPLLGGQGGRDRA